MNDPQSYGQFKNVEGFQKKIPTFAHSVKVHYHPWFIKGGQYMQLSFKGIPQELEPYI